MKNNLTDAEIALVQSFVANEPMCDAVKKVILHTLYLQGNPQNGEGTNWVFGLIKDPENLFVETQDNQWLGERVRAMASGIGLLNSGFTLIKDEFKKVEQVEKPVNPAL